MRITEVTDNVKYYKVAKRPSGLFSIPWKIFRFPKKMHGSKECSQIGLYGNSVHGLAEIRGKTIIWEMFGHEGKGKVGGFREITDPSKIPSNLEWHPQITSDDIKAAALYIQWDNATAASRPALEERFKALNVSKQFKKAPRKLYRGMQLDPKHIKALSDGKSIPLKPRVVSSWTTKYYNAKTFTGYENGLIVIEQFGPQDICVNLHLLDEFFGLPLEDRYVMSENEILVYGNGIGKRIDPATINAYFDHNEKN